MIFKLIIDAKAIIAETPIWDHRINKLYWTDTLKGDVHQYDPVLKTDKIWHTDRPIGSAVPCNDENYVFCALEGGMYRLDLRTSELKFIVKPEDQPFFKYNDTRIDPCGRIFTSTVSVFFGTDKFLPSMQGAFFMIDPDLSIKTLVSDIQQYNGIVWNSEKTKMFVVDTGNQKLLEFPYSLENGAESNYFEVIDFTEIGMPDGLSIDVEDNLYVCHWTGKISVWDKNFNLKEIIDFPVEYVCCCGFGGPDMKDIFVATSSYNYSGSDYERNPGAGGIFVSRSQIKGCPDNFFR